MTISIFSFLSYTCYLLHQDHNHHLSNQKNAKSTLHLPMWRFPWNCARKMSVALRRRRACVREGGAGGIVPVAGGIICIVGVGWEYCA